MNWIIVLGVIVLFLYVLTRKTDDRKPSGKSMAGGKSTGRGTNFLPPIPKGFQIFNARLSVAGIQHRRDDARRFADDSDQTLALEREPENTHDANAIKVMGVTRGTRRFIGYVPKEVAEQIVGSALADVVQPRLERIWRTDNGFVDVIFQIVGPKDKKAQYIDFRSNKPADAWQKECLKFFGLPVSKGLTTGQAAKIIAEHRTKLETEDKARLDEWDAYEEICNEFNDADFRASFELKKVSDKVLKEALDALKREGATMRSLAADIDTVVDKVIALKPDLERK
ncbi:MAG: HIRAN domain-containing protein [Burkholderiales bacterium]|nr:HIRAN domain-containing protein [Burkholderiales bacterium]